MQRKASSDRWRGGARYFRFRFRSLGKFCFLLQCASTLVEEKEKKKAEIKQTRRKKGKSRVTVFSSFPFCFSACSVSPRGATIFQPVFHGVFPLGNFRGAFSSKGISISISWRNINKIHCATRRIKTSQFPLLFLFSPRFT